MKRASLFVRFVAFFLDILILSFVSLILFLLCLPGIAKGIESYAFLKITCFLSLFLCSTSFVIIFYFTYLGMKNGQTIGKNFFHIRIIGIDGREIGFFRSLLRTFSYATSALPCMAGFFIAIFLRKRALHDLIARTQVIEEEL